MMTVAFRLRYLFIVLFFLMGTAAFADTVSFVGDTTGQPTWNRTNLSCNDLSVVGSAVNYQTRAFTVSANDSCRLTLNSASFDTYLSVYSGAFDPNNQSTNCIAINDDIGIQGVGNSLGGLNSQIPGPPPAVPPFPPLLLNAGQTYVFVATAWGSGQAGQFDAFISCPTAKVTLITPDIPTLSVWTLVLLILLLGFMG